MQRKGEWYRNVYEEKEDWRTEKTSIADHLDVFWPTMLFFKLNNNMKLLCLVYGKASHSFIDHWAYSSTMDKRTSIKQVLFLLETLLSNDNVLLRMEVKF